MIKILLLKYVFAIVVFIAIFSCNSNLPTRQDNSFIIDPNIKNEVLKHADQSTIKIGGTGGVEFTNKCFIEVYENDTLVKREFRDSISIIDRFYAYHLIGTKNATINASTGSYKGIGFEIEIQNNKPTLYFIDQYSEGLWYKINLQDSLKKTYQISVPTSNSKIILSEDPFKLKSTLLYGYVEFKGNEYYRMSYGELVKFRVNMKAYFISYIYSNG